MISVDEALSRLFALCAPLGPETVPLRRAAGRILAAPVVARRDQPPFAASAMDGYAIHAADDRPGSCIRIIGEAAAGLRFSGEVSPGHAVRIFTGAPIPVGAARVVIQEDVHRDGDNITLGDRLDSGTHMRPAGQDFRAGAQISAPRQLSCADLGLIAAMNVAEVSVARRPIVAVIATGNELVMPGEAPGPDQIIASNSFALAALAEAAGADVRMLPIARDTEASLRYTLGLATGADLIVTSGGASVGDHDLVGHVTEAMGMERSFYKIAMRPGKPLMAGRLGKSLLLGLPGNPVSSMVCGHIFMLPLLRAMQGLPAAPAPVKRALLARPVAANGVRAHYMRARVADRDGVDYLDPFDRQDSALLSVLADANALLVRPVDDPALPTGAAVSYIPL
ncbi:MAG: gephyrin-like molybdotransferase Glp [Albidovulum sp.]